MESGSRPRNTQNTRKGIGRQSNAGIHGIAGKTSPQTVFPARPGEWGCVRTDSIPRGSLQGARNDPSIVGSEHARRDQTSLAIGGHGGSAVLGDGRLVGRDLGL